MYLSVDSKLHMHFVQQKKNSYFNFTLTGKASVVLSASVHNTQHNIFFTCNMKMSLINLITIQQNTQNSFSLIAEQEEEEEKDNENL